MATRELGKSSEEERANPNAGVDGAEGVDNNLLPSSKVLVVDDKPLRGA